MESLLHVVKSESISDDKEENLVPVIAAPSSSLPQNATHRSHNIGNASEALNVIQNQPTFDELSNCLEWLADESERFNVRIPGPTATQIISVLVSDIIPSYWTIIRSRDHLRLRKWLISCLRSVPGLGALITRLKFILNDPLNGNSAPETTRRTRCKELLEVLDSVLHGNLVLVRLWSDSNTSNQNPIQRRLAWKELISILSSGKLLSTAAQALELQDDIESPLLWLGEGASYSSWIGKNIGMLALSSREKGSEVYSSAASMFGRALSLGHQDLLTDMAFSALLAGDTRRKDSEIELFDHLSIVDRTRTFSSILSILNRKFLGTSKTHHRKLISGISAILKLFLDRNSQLKPYLATWLAQPPANAMGAELNMRRAVVSVIFSYDELPGETLNKLLVQFADKIYIQHAPSINQEVCSQNLLLLVGCMYRRDASLLRTIARSSIFINAISNRLAASSEKPRLLGMIVGTAMSELVDSPDKRMKFTGLLEGFDMEWYMELTGIQDEIGAVADLASVIRETTEQPEAIIKSITRKSPNKKTLVRNTTSKIISIEELSSEDDEIPDPVVFDSEQDDLPMYEKPDSDAEDSDDDPTLVNRNKPTPPVYIRDLITYLKDTENHDRHVLALTHAAGLIRRKSSYGTEVKDHIEDLASLFCSMKDEHDIESWQQQRIAAMVAVILAWPESMGKWFANMVFSGDFSISQRASMLTAIALSARELAGYAAEDAELTIAPNISTDVFPSKQLPPRYAKLYTQSTTGITTAARHLENSMLQPLAAQALDEMNAAPAILKTRTFSSRLAVESRKKPISNKLPPILANDFFFPLTNRWQAYVIMHSSPSANGYGNVFQTPVLHAHFLKTLALLLAAGGPSSLSLPGLTDEFWTILLAAQTRIAASEALPVLESVLFGILTLLDSNGAGIEGEDRSKRRLAEECGEKLVETQAWVGVIMERIGSGISAKGLSKEEDRVRMLAAGVLIRVEEVVERYQRLLMGMLAGI